MWLSALEEKDMDYGVTTRFCHSWFAHSVLHSPALEHTPHALLLSFVFALWALVALGSCPFLDCNLCRSFSWNALPPFPIWFLPSNPSYINKTSQFFWYVLSSLYFNSITLPLFVTQFHSPLSSILKSRKTKSCSFLHKFATDLFGGKNLT